MQVAKRKKIKMDKEKNIKVKTSSHKKLLIYHALSGRSMKEIASEALDIYVEKKMEEIRKEEEKKGK